MYVSVYVCMYVHKYMIKHHWQPESPAIISHISVTAWAVVSVLCPPETNFQKIKKIVEICLQPVTQTSEKT